MAEPTDTWRIEVEQTDRYVRSREYRVGGPVSLTWVRTDFDRDPRDPFKIKIEALREVTPWPELEWEEELEFSKPTHQTQSVMLHFPQTPPPARDPIERVPGFYRVKLYAQTLVDQHRYPRRVKVHLKQTAFRAVCSVTVLDWSEPDPNLENYVSKPSKEGQTFALYASGSESEEGSAEPSSPPTTRPHLEIRGIHPGMSSEEVLGLWSDELEELHVGYRPDTGRVIFLYGNTLKVDETLYEAGHPPAELEDRLKELGFTEPESLAAMEAQDPEWSLRDMQRILRHPNVIVTLTLEEGLIHGIGLIGATEDLPEDFPRLDWMGPAPTVGGVALGSTPEQVRRALGKPLHIHQRDGSEVFCYEPGDCPDSDDQPVKLHVEFQGDSCRSIRGDQLEQNGQLILHSRFRMPPIHSMGEALAVEDSSHHLTRTTTRETGPRHVVYSPDLNLEVWIYPDGKRQFILRRVELPATVINLEYP